jgi:antitoxin YefM
MAHVSYTELRSKLASYMEQVCDSRAPLHVTRQNARGVVLLSQDEFEAMMETLHLLRSPANAARLLESIAEADRGTFHDHDPTEPSSTGRAG